MVTAQLEQPKCDLCGASSTTLVGVWQNDDDLLYAVCGEHGPDERRTFFLWYTSERKE